MSADDIQIGGTHYKDLKIQPWSVMEAWGPKEHFVGFLRFNALKRLGRWDSKDSAIQDAEKAIHELTKMVEVMKAMPEYTAKVRVSGVPYEVDSKSITNRATLDKYMKPLYDTGPSRSEFREIDDGK